MDIPLHGNAFAHGLKGNALQIHILPQNMENIGVILGHGNFLFQPQDIVFLNGNLRRIYIAFPKFQRADLFLRKQIHRRFFVIQLLHAGFQGKERLYGKLPGIDFSHRQIFQARLYRYRIRSLHPFHIKLLFKRNFAVDINQHLSLVLRLVKHRKKKSSPDAYMVFCRFDFFYLYHCLVKNNPAHVRLVVGNVDVFFQSDLRGTLAFDTVHMYVFLNQFHFRYLHTSTAYRYYMKAAKEIC